MSVDHTENHASVGADTHDDERILDLDGYFRRLLIPVAIVLR
jgi:hypothetical protein